MLKERVELLAIGEAIGYPRLGIGHRDGKKLAIKAGQPGWEQFCGHAHTTRIPAALRIGRILRDNGVMPYNPRETPREVEVSGNQVKAYSTEEVPFPDGTATRHIVRTHTVVALDDPIDEMVKPKRSSAAIRQQRWREKQKIAKS